MMKGITATQAGATGSSLLVSGVMFGLSMVLSLAFGYYLATDPSRLADVWIWVRSLPLMVQVVLWLVLLPWMLSLWILSMPWALGVRIALVVVLLVVSEYLLLPWKR
jgi:hypothetical protein